GGADGNPIRVGGGGRRQRGWNGHAALSVIARLRLARI
ncbi:MAG: hypothetical protein AVDCRST_MAG62-603, partial [uncultured Sphingomonas sp.]